MRNALSARVPCSDDAFRVEHENRVIHHAFDEQPELLLLAAGFGMFRGRADPQTLTERAGTRPAALRACGATRESRRMMEAHVCECYAVVKAETDRLLSYKFLLTHCRAVATA
jgi:hypothetical protein